MSYWWLILVESLKERDLSVERIIILKCIWKEMSYEFCTLTDEDYVGLYHDSGRSSNFELQ